MNNINKFVSATVGLGTGYFIWAAGRHEKIDFNGRSVVITGGSRGLGLVLARQLAREGAHLSLIAQDEAELERAGANLSNLGAQVLLIACDLREREQAENAIRQVLSHYGKIDVLINNAGTIQVGPLEHIELEDFEDAMATHFWAALYTMQTAVPAMRKQGGGRIVNISSIGGRIAVPHMLPYSASKHALIGLSDGMRNELAKDKIYVTTVSPGLLRTGSPPNAFFKGRQREEYSWFAISDSSPLLAIDAGRAAHQIIEACRVGKPELTITWQARAAIIANVLFPDLTATVLSLANQFLPKSTKDEQGDRLQTGWESQSNLAPSALTSLSDRATMDNNGLKDNPASALKND